MVSGRAEYLTGGGNKMKDIVRYKNFTTRKLRADLLPRIKLMAYAMGLTQEDGFNLALETGLSMLEPQVDAVRKAARMGGAVIEEPRRPAEVGASAPASSPAPAKGRVIDDSQGN